MVNRNQNIVPVKLIAAIGGYCGPSYRIEWDGKNFTFTAIGHVAQELNRKIRFSRNHILSILTLVLDLNIGLTVLVLLKEHAFNEIAIMVMAYSVLMKEEFTKDPGQ